MRRARDLAAAFLAGWAIMQLEILGGRALAPYFGYSIYQWGALIGVVMTALAIGYYLGGRLGDRPSARRTLCLAIGAAAIFALALPHLAGPVLPGMRAAGPAWGAVWASAVLLGPPSVLLAMTSPIVVRLTATGRIAGNAGTVTAISTAGSIAGTFATAFWIIPEFGTRLGFYGAAGVTALALVALLATRRGAGLAAAGAVAALAAGFPRALPLPPHGLFRAESLHNIIEIDEHDDTRLMYLGYRAAPQTVEVKDKLLTGEYYDLFLLGPRVTEARRALVLGVAGGVVLKQLVRKYPDLHVTGVDLDPSVLAAARRFFGLGELPRTNLVAEDARWFLHDRAAHYDLIVLDVYVTGHVPFYVASAEFFALVKSRLSPRGVMMMNILSPAPGDGLIGPMVETIRLHFPSVHLIGHANVIAIATVEPLSEDALRARLTGAGADADLHEVLVAAMPSLRAPAPGRVWRAFTDDRSDVEIRSFRQRYGPH